MIFVTILFCRFQDFVREELLYLLYPPKTTLTVMSLWDTSLCTVCALPWPASSFCSPPSWLVFVAAKTHEQLFKTGDCLLVWNGIHIYSGIEAVCVTSICCTDGGFATVYFSDSGSLSFWSWLGLLWELFLSLMEHFILVIICCVKLH